MKYELTKHAQDVLENRKINLLWVQKSIKNPSRVDNISDVETHYYSVIEEMENRCLKVVFNPKTYKIITLYFDRNMRKKGCKWKLNMMISKMRFI